MNVTSVIYTTVVAVCLAIGAWLGHAIGSGSQSDALITCQAQIAGHGQAIAQAEKTAREEVHKLLTAELRARDERIERYELAMNTYIRIQKETEADLTATQQRLAELQRRDPVAKRLLDTDITRLRDPERLRKQPTDAKR